MALRSKIDHPEGGVLGKSGRNGLAIGDVAMNEVVARMVFDLLQAAQVAGVGEFVKDNDAHVGLCQSQTDEIGPDKAGAAGHNHGVHKGWALLA